MIMSKSMRKRFSACLLAAVFMLLLIPCKARAAGISPPENAAAEGPSASFAELVGSENGQRAELNAGIQKAPLNGTIKVSSVTAKPGETVTLDVSIDSNPGICGFVLGFDCDPALTLKKVEFVPASLKTESDNFNTDEGKGNFWYSKKAVWLYGSDTTYTGKWLKLTLEVKNSATDGDKPVKVTFSAGDITNIKEEAVSFTATAGKVTVSKDGGRVPGDVNGDGKVTSLDSTLIKRYVVGGYEIATFIKANADVNGDGKITSVDATLVKRYVVGGYGVVLK